MPRPLNLRWWPRSLVGRVFALYSVTLAGFVALSLLAFYRYQLSGALEEAQLRADALTAVMLPAVTDSAVIGDYDTIRRTLERALFHSSFSDASFIDLQGGVVRVPRGEVAEVVPPRWLRDTVAARLYDSNLPVNVGGRDYGVLRLSFAPERIAGELWKQTRIALLLGLLSTAGGVLLIRVLLTRWLGELGRVQAYYDAAMRSDPERSGAGVGVTQTPLEFRETFEVLDRAAASLRSQRAQAEVTLGAIADGVFTLDERGRVLYANPAACALVGHPLEALLGMPVRPLLAPLFAVEGEPQPADPAGAPLQPWTARRSVLPAAGAATGGVRVIDSSLSTLLAPDGHCAGHVLACHDVTRQHQLDQRLRQELHARESALAELRQVLERQAADLPAAAASAAAGDDLAAISRLVSELARRLQLRGEQLDAIFALSAEGFASFDAHGRVNYVSPSFATLTGLDAAELIGADETRVAGLLGKAAAGDLPWRGWAMLREAAAPAAGSGATTPRRVLLELRRPARRTLALALALHRSGAGGGGVISQVLSVRDVTHETLVEQMKSEFLSTAAHELRTPMASIYGFTELLLHRPMKEERRADILATIHRQSQRMIAILNELLDLARIEARRGQDFVFEAVELGALLAEVRHDFQPPAAREAPDWQRPGAPAWVRVDRNKLQQALLNVLSNAYKYSPAGGPVTLRLVDGGTPAQPRVGIEVVDCGIGLSPEQLARVGERFYRADSSGTIAGTGLGMSIVKEILELLGGRLELASTPGQGTRVTLWLPRVAAPGGSAETTPSQLL